MLDRVAMAPVIVPPPMCWSSAAALRSASGGAEGSVPRSNRDEASVFRFNRLAVRRTLAGRNHAASNTMRSVRAAAWASKAKIDELTLKRLK